VEQQKSNNNQFIDLKSIYDLFVKNWYIFAISLFITLSAAVVFNKIAAPVYRASASLLFKQEDSRRMDPGEFLQGFQLMREELDFNNEILVLQSVPLIKEVIRQLNFNVSYYVKQDYIPKEIYFVIQEVYTGSPYLVVPDLNHPQPVGVRFFIQILNDEEFYIHIEEKEVDVYDFRSEKVLYAANNLKISNVHRFGEDIKGEYYSFKVLLKSNYSDQYSGEDLYFSFNNISALANSYREALLVEPVNTEVSVVRVSFDGPNIPQAIDFVKKLTEEYLRQNLEEKNHLAFTTIEYIDRQLEEITDSLAYTEQELQDFRRNFQVMNIAQKAERTYDQLQQLENERASQQAQLRLYTEMEMYFEINKDSTDLLAPSALGINDPNLSNLIQELTTLNAEKYTMLENNQERSPRLASINSRIENLKNTISENIRYSISTANVQLTDLGNRIRSYQYEVNQLPQTQRRLLGIERKFNINNEVYTFLLEKRAEAQIARASNLPDSEILEPAQYSGKVFPKSTRNYLLAIIVGLFLPIAFIEGRRALSKKITSREDLEDILNLPIPGKIIHSNLKSSLAIIDHPSSQVADAFRALRTNLVYHLKEDNETKVILVSSTMQGDGKSYIALNLASAFAINHKKTILLGFDLRKPSEIYEDLNLEDLLGLSSYLNGNSALEDIIVKTEIDHLDVIAAGTIPPNPLELISSYRTDELFYQLKELYDFIIVDSPPVGIIPDTLGLLNHSDLNLVVVRHNYTLKKLVHNAFKELKQLDIQNLMLIYNDERLTKEDRSYKYYSYGKK
jgi:capsular exopolysaccharide synthesis family protein